MPWATAPLAASFGLYNLLQALSLCSGPRGTLLPWPPSGSKEHSLESTPLPHQAPLSTRKGRQDQIGVSGKKPAASAGPPSQGEVSLLAGVGVLPGRKLGPVSQGPVCLWSRGSEAMPRPGLTHKRGGSSSVLGENRIRGPIPRLTHSSVHPELCELGQAPSLLWASISHL